MATTTTTITIDDLRATSASEATQREQAYAELASVQERVALYRRVTDPNLRFALEEPVAPELFWTARSELPDLERQLGVLTLRAAEHGRRAEAAQRAWHEALSAQHRHDQKILLRTAARDVRALQKLMTRISDCQLALAEAQGAAFHNPIAMRAFCGPNSEASAWLVRMEAEGLIDPQ